MSTQYKLDKYLNKLKNASDVTKMDEYYRKVKQYKLAQNGGTVWRDDLDPRVNKLKDIEQKSQEIQNKIQENSGKIDVIKQSVGDMQGKYDNIGNNLVDALEYLKEISDMIETSGIDKLDIDGITKVITGLDGIGKLTEIQSEKVWKLINSGFPYNDDKNLLMDVIKSGDDMVEKVMGVLANKPMTKDATGNDIVDNQTLLQSIKDMVKQPSNGAQTQE